MKEGLPQAFAEYATQHCDQYLSSRLGRFEQTANMISTGNAAYLQNVVGVVNQFSTKLAENAARSSDAVGTLSKRLNEETRNIRTRLEQMEETLDQVSTAGPSGGGTTMGGGAERQIVRTNGQPVVGRADGKSNAWTQQFQPYSAPKQNFGASPTIPASFPVARGHPPLQQSFKPFAPSQFPPST